jgi:hypothetical protein
VWQEERLLPGDLLCRVCWTGTPSRLRYWIYYNAIASLLNCLFHCTLTNTNFPRQESYYSRVRSQQDIRLVY